MAGIYGEFLGFFSELFETFRVYKQSPDAVSGYSLEYSRQITAIRQTNGDKVNTDRYRRVPVMDIVKGFTLWSKEELSLVDEFVLIDGKYFRPMGTSVFNREGGFYETELEMVVGNDGTKTLTPTLTEGSFE